MLIQKVKDPHTTSTYHYIISPEGLLELQERMREGASKTVSDIVSKFILKVKDTGELKDKFESAIERQATLFLLLQREGAQTRTQLKELTGYKSTTLYDNLFKLLLTNKVQKIRKRETIWTIKDD